MVLFNNNLETKSIYSRFRNDINTKLRKKYDIYYHVFEKQIGSHVWLNGKEYILLSSNDYLGLGNHKMVVERMQLFIDKWGSGTTGSRIANGGRLYHKELEEKLANFLGKEACHISVCGYISCMSAVQGFATKDDLILADNNIHSCLWAGILLSGASVERFKHNDVYDLNRILNKYEYSKSKILVIEGVYSMEGHIAPLNDFLKTIQKKNVFVVLDDAHGFGVLGKQGRGTANYFNAGESVDVVCGSFSKALSSTGGFVAGTKDSIEYLRTTSKQTIFSAALSPSQAGAADAILDIMQGEPEHLDKLWESTYRYKKILKELKFDFWGSETPSVPIILDTKERAYFLWKFLKDNGIYTVLSIPPAVPAGKNILRTAISARHTEDDLCKIFDTFKEAYKKIF